MKKTNRTIDALVNELKTGTIFVWFDEYKRLLAFMEKHKIDFHYYCTKHKEKHFPKIQITI